MDITTYITDCINNKIPVKFLKFGDGEYYAANGFNGQNCDNDKYTDKLKQGLLNSFKYLVDNTDNSYIGLWHGSIHKDFWESLVNNPVKWVNYHTILMDGDKHNEKIELYKSIKNSPLKKIYICNPLMIKVQILLNIDIIVGVKYNNWFDNEFDNVLQTILNSIDPKEQYIIITSCGMSSKVLITELSKIYPNYIYLDFGSALDVLCTKKNTRTWEPSYEQSLIDFKDLIPLDWNNPKYNYIYKQAYKKLT